MHKRTIMKCLNFQYMLMASVYCGSVLLMIYLAWDATMYANKFKPHHRNKTYKGGNRSIKRDLSGDLQNMNRIPKTMAFQQNNFSYINKAESSTLKLSTIPLVSVVCDVEADEEHETFKYMSVYLKTLAIFNTNTVNIIFIMNQGEEVIKKITENWSREYTETLNITIVPPDEQLQDSNGGCQAHKVYLDQMFPLIESVIVSNLDVIFLRPLESLFKEFETAPADKIIGYTENQKNALNCGFLLLNLTRMRDINIPKPTIWKNMEKSEYDRQVTEVLNIYQALTYNIPLTWKLHSEFYKNLISSIDGISALHGCENSFLEGKEFFNIFRYFKSLSLNQNKRRIIELFLEDVENKNICAGSVCAENFDFKALISYYPKLLHSQFYSAALMY